MNVEELVAQSRSKTGCWAFRLNGIADEYMRAVDAEIRTGVKHSPNAVRDIILQLSGESLNASTIKHHLSKGCGCWKS